MSQETIWRLLRQVGDYLPLIIFLLVVPIATYLSHRRRQGQIKKLKELAAKLGLQFKGEDPKELEQTYRQKMAAYQGGDRARAEQAFRRLEQSGFLKSLLSFAQPLAISGRYNGCQAEIKLMHQNKKDYTEIRVFFPEALGLGLKIVRSGFWHRSLSLGQTAKLETGNAELDRMIAIQSKDELKARYLARSVQSQQALLTLFQHSGAEVNDREILVRQDGHQVEYHKCKKLLDDMTRTAKAIADSLGVKDRNLDNSNEN